MFFPPSGIDLFGFLWGVHPWKLAWEPENHPIEKEIIFSTVIVGLGVSKVNWLPLHLIFRFNGVVSVLRPLLLFFITSVQQLKTGDPWGSGNRVTCLYIGAGDGARSEAE